MSRSLTHKAKMIYIIGGFLSTVVGTLWSFAIVDRLTEERRQLSDTKTDLRRQLSDTKAEFDRQIKSLNSIASEYFIANQQGDLIFILAQQGNARQDIASLVYKGNLLDRATPVRNMIGVLAIAKQLDYRQTYDAYERLNDETRTNLLFDNFTKLKQVEKAIIAKGQERVPLLLDDQFQFEKAINSKEALIEKALNANEASQKKKRVLGLIASFLGGFLLLAANLISSRAEDK